MDARSDVPGTCSRMSGLKSHNTLDISRRKPLASLFILFLLFVFLLLLLLLFVCFVFVDQLVLLLAHFLRDSKECSGQLLLSVVVVVKRKCNPYFPK